jgi:hypothetical protein
VRVRPLAAFSGEVILVAPRIPGLGCQRLPIGFAIPIRQPLTAAIPLQRSGQSTMLFAVRAPQSKPAMLCDATLSNHDHDSNTPRLLGPLDDGVEWDGVVSDTMVQ